ncbi:hypothetical protein CHS0354_016015 [Potamilus streckersoni]|uniref:Uncharacterized protein n=1 Tax=Potamilus streckersoni TaxID=2493646 RepID=A0AAE0RMI4_9BIVA|nr:hypothetical protein CHS0354_016015 [Potamilus streckersoni]
MSKKKCVLRIQVLLAFVLTFVLQAMGLFSTYWHVQENIHKGLFYQCDSDKCSTEVISQAALGLECTSFIILFFCMLCAWTSICCFGPDDDGIFMNDDGKGSFIFSALCYYCWLALYPIAGILSLVGCIVFGSNNDTIDLGWSFYMCIASGSITILAVCTLCMDYICMKSSQKSFARSLLYEMYLEN